MKNIWYIAERELKSYFSSPIAYVLTSIFLGISGFVYIVVLYNMRQADMRAVIMNMSVLFLFLCPLMTMRLIAEERRSGTIEVLLTAPISETEAVMGKFFGGVLMMAVMLVLTMHFPIFLLIYGQPDKGPLFISYLGLLLVSSCYLSLGILASSFARNQIVAAVAGFGFILMLWLLSAAANLFSPPVSDILKYLSFYDHFEDFVRGIIDTRHIIYYFSFAGFMLFLTILNLKNKKWR